LHDESHKQDARGLTGLPNERLKFSASLIHGDLLYLKDTIEKLEAAGCDELHIHASDGHFIPGLTCGPALVSAVKRATGLPCTAHLMVVNPDAHLAAFADAGADAIVVPVESSVHIHRTLMKISDLGPACGVSINMATPLTKLEYILHMIDRVHLMVRDPGVTGNRHPQSTFDRVRILRQNLDYQERGTVLAVEGVHDPASAALFANMGAELLVLDENVLFKGPDLAEQLAAFKAALAQQRHLV
jgi:ribulose-phosphate 3-epimerase